MATEQALWRRINKPFASLKLAVFIILAMGIMSAYGTIVESQYNDARRAQELVYHSWWAYLIFIALAINLIAVMLDRLPWQRKHGAFVCAHIGIITMLLGSLLTYYYGVDGSLAIEIGKKKSQVALPGYREVTLWGGLANGTWQEIQTTTVNFLKDPPTEEKPLVIEVPEGKIIVDAFQPYSIGETKVEPSMSPTDGPGLRFQIANTRVKETQWIVLNNRPMESAFLGPAQIVLAKKGFFQYTSGNILLLEYTDENETLDYKIFTDRLQKMTSSGQIKAGGMVETGWMGLTFRLLKYLPKAKQIFKYTPVARGGDGIFPSIRVRFNGDTQWLALNSSIRLFTADAMYYLGFVNRIIKLDFDLELVDFAVGRYQGSQRAASYASDVRIVEGNQRSEVINISMNEPLYHKGFTFYQSSFAENEFGKPTTSIFSVNRDPGRPWKYLGSILIVTGAIWLFYFNRPRKKGKST